MKLVTGDIAINARSWPGHVMMVYTGGSEAANTTQVIHATNSRDFHIDPQYDSSKDGNDQMLITGDCWIFRAPWAILPAAFAEQRRKEIQAVAKAMATSAKYGGYRAVRLFLGSSEYGPDARLRLTKYRERKAAFLAGAGNKFVSTVTCAEAVILCYQLVFDDRSPIFIQKDAAHTMPRTLREYLQQSRWEVIQAGTG